MGDKPKKQPITPQIKDPSYFDLEFWSQYLRMSEDGEGLLLSTKFWKEVRGKSLKAEKLMNLEYSIITNPEKFKGKIPIATKEEETGFKEGDKYE